MLPSQQSQTKVQTTQSDIEPSRPWAHPAVVKTFLFATLLASFAGAIIIGPFPIDLKAAFSDLFQNTDTLSRAQKTILYDIRLPRAVAAALVGIALAICGACMQALFRNPLADPGLVGVTSGAALGAAFYIKFAASLLASFSVFFGNFALPLCAFAGGLGVTWIIQKIAVVHGRSVLSIMLLAGIAINALGGAGIGIILFFSDDDMLRQFTFWTLGNVGQATWMKLVFASPLMIFAALTALRSARQLNALLLGEAEAQHLGVDLPKLKRILIFATAAGVAASVSLAGGIGFIGLVVPHIIRQWIGPDHRALVPCSALLGGVLLLIADTLSRTIAAPAELPVGTLTALMGAPVFFSILYKQRSTV